MIARVPGPCYDLGVRCGDIHDILLKQLKHEDNYV